MQSPLAEVVLDLGLVGIAKGNTGDPREDSTQLDLANAVEVDPTRCQTP